MVFDDNRRQEKSTKLFHPSSFQKEVAVAMCRKKHDQNLLKENEHSSKVTT